MNTFFKIIGLSWKKTVYEQLFNLCKNIIIDTIFSRQTVESNSGQFTDIVLNYMDKNIQINYHGMTTITRTLA